VTGSSDVFLCSGARGVELHLSALGKGGLNLEIQHFVSAECFGDDFGERIRRIEELSKIDGLRFGFHAPFRQVNYLSRNEARRRHSREILWRALDVAARFEAEFVVLHSLFHPGRRNENYNTRWREVALPFLAEAAREAAARGLRIAVENMLETSPGALLDLVKETAVPETCVCFDVAHAAIAGGATAAEWVEGLGSTLAHMHLSDNHGVHDDHLPFGRGTVDLAGALHAAAALAHPVTLGIECRLYPAGNLSESLGFVERTLGLSPQARGGASA
jgi:sugar phosphate isomerase/epimerase